MPPGPADNIVFHFSMDGSVLHMVRDISGRVFLLGFGPEFSGPSFFDNSLINDRKFEGLDFSMVRASS